MKWVAIIVGVLLVLFLFLGKSPISAKITGGFRDSAIGAGKVLILRNDSGRHYYNLKVSVRNYGADTSTSKIIDKEFTPDEVVEVGWMEFGNWILEPGELVYVSVDSNPLPVTFKVPE